MRGMKQNGAPPSSLPFGGTTLHQLGYIFYEWSPDLSPYLPKGLCLYIYPDISHSINMFDDKILIFHGPITNFLGWKTGQALGIQIAHHGTEVVKEVKHRRSLLEARDGMILEVLCIVSDHVWDVWYMIWYMIWYYIYSYLFIYLYLHYLISCAYLCIVDRR